MSRNGIFLYFSYVFLLLSVPIRAEDATIDFSDGDQVQIVLDIHDTITESNGRHGWASLGIVQKCQLVAFGLCYKSAKALGLVNVYKNSSIEGILEAAPALKYLGGSAAKDFADLQHTISPERVALLQKVSETHDITYLSNIGPDNMAKMKARESQLFNDNVIRGGTLVKYAQGQKPKPDTEIFTRHDGKYTQINPKTGEAKVKVLFDDKQDNVDAANSRPGWCGYLVSKSIPLEARFLELGIVRSLPQLEEIAEPVNA
jgi:hypothetical protein